jgi:uncharacterized membrane protein
MRAFYLISVYLHILAMLLWLGGAVFFALLVLPFFKKHLPLELRNYLIWVEPLFKKLGWGCFAMLWLTGIVNLFFRVPLENLKTWSFWSQGWGLTLFLKLFVVVVLMALALWHDLRIGPRAIEAWGRDSSSLETARLRSRAAVLGRLIALLGLIVVFLAVALARGGLF